MAKRILGLDLGTTSIGWAVVTEAQEANEISTIEKLGVRVNPLTTDEQTDFQKGKPITTNANRTLARSARRSLQRFKLRRENLVKILLENNWINEDELLAESGNKSTFETYGFRNAAATTQIQLNQFARVLLMINKKRGYKSSRKVNNTEEGQLVDGMEIAKKLYNENLTPGQYVLELLNDGKKKIPDFYRSDLQNELEQIWQVQQKYHPQILTNDFKAKIDGKGARLTAQTFYAIYQFNTAENTGTKDQKKIQAYQWRVDALTKQLTQPELAYVIADINGQLTNSSGYLGAISDRSKALFFNKQTVGQFLFKQLQQNPNNSTKGKVFYRQDYLDEFETIWQVQAKGREKQLTNQLKAEIRDVVIFYQRKLKSQKNLVSLCQLEHKEISVNGVKKTIGYRVAPKSAPLFQQFKIWQQLHNVRIKDKTTKQILELAQEDKQLLFQELNVKGKMAAAKVLKTLNYNKNYELNYKELEGNNTNAALYNAYLNILDAEGYDVKAELKIKLNKDEIALTDLEVPAHTITQMIEEIFNHLGINTQILYFNPNLDGQNFENQPAYQLWHLLYAYEEDNSTTGLAHLYQLLNKKFGFNTEQAKLLAKVVFQPDYGNLSSKAMRKIYPNILENEYDKACVLASYNHSVNSLTKEQLANRTLKAKLDILPKNSLRNPVVEKILNQMVNVVNTIIDTENIKRKEVGLPQDFKFDEIRIELARELKKNAAERAEQTNQINRSNTAHQAIIKILQQQDGIKNPTRNDIIRYKLYQELKDNGYKDLYTNTYIQRENLFNNNYDIDHIIPQSRLFDDSFSNKTLVPRQVNIEKSNRTAADYIADKFGQKGLDSFTQSIEKLYEINKKNADSGITKAKYLKLLKTATDIGDGFIERDLRDTQYIAKKAKEMLFQITPNVVTTSGKITDRLRQDWDLVNVMKELNFDKYKALGLTETIQNKNGSNKEVITEWTKRNDHRHHAMDALTIAFTKKSFIQYLNNLNARNTDAAQTIANTQHKNTLTASNLTIATADVIAIEAKETIKLKDGDGNYKRVFKQPIPNFRQLAKTQLQQVLVSHKTKNKVATKNKNIVAGANTPQITLTPRGQLHKETVYAKIKQHIVLVEKVSAKFNQQTIAKVSNPTYRNLLLNRLQQNNNDPKKAFTGKNALDKTPIYTNASKTQVIPDKVKLIAFEDSFVIRKPIAPDLKIDKVIDQGIKRILQQRLAQYNDDPKKAFTDLESNPIWLNQQKGIAIKSVTISGVKNAEALHHKIDNAKNPLLDVNGNKQPTSFVSTGNNHHVAIYTDQKGNLQETVVSFYEAVARLNANLPIVDKQYNQSLGWQFLFTLKQNEMFIFPTSTFNPKEIDLTNPNNYALISPNLFRVQKIATKDYFFRHHLETNVDDKSILKGTTWRREGLAGIKHIVKVRLNHLGQIMQIGEY